MAVVLGPSCCLRTLFQESNLVLNQFLDAALGHVNQRNRYGKLRGCLGAGHAIQREQLKGAPSVRLDPPRYPEHGKLEQQPLNEMATHLWMQALRRQNRSEMSSRDFLVGSIVVLFGDREFMSEL